MHQKIFALVVILIAMLSASQTIFSAEDVPPISVYQFSPVPLPSQTAPLTKTVAPNAVAAQTFFPIGAGFSDVLSHQIVRTNTDHLYVFAGYPYSPTITAYWTSGTGLPNSQSNFNGTARVSVGDNVMAVDSAYDGGNIIHVLVNMTTNGVIQDIPFDTNANAFKSAITITTIGHSIVGDYIGTSGIAGMFDPTQNVLHVAYWNNADHILYRAFAYNSATNALTPVAAWFQVDANGNANHPSLAVSPSDDSLTLAWVYGKTNTDQGKIAARSRASNGTWGAETQVSTARAWTDSSAGINIDQGPSLIVSTNGIKQLAYIENYDATTDYGHVHYVSSNGSSWIDQTLADYTHDPALALNSAGEMFIIGHGHSQNPAASPCLSMLDMCLIKKNGAMWNVPQLIATHPNNQSFDSSPSIKWSVAGFNRPETVEFIFFSTPYNNPTLYYGRLASAATSNNFYVYLPLVLKMP